MKKKLYLFGFILLLSSCSSSGKYEQTIADFVQTDKKGTKYNLKFKVIDIKELQKITVADSVTFLTDKWNVEKEKRINSLNESIDSYKQSIENEKKNRFSLPTIIDKYQKYLADAEHTLDSIQTKTPDWVEIYNDRKKDEILAIVVECKYKALHPVTNTEFEETRDFILSADGTKCYSQSAPKK